MYQNIAEIYEQFGWGAFSENLLRKIKPLAKKWKIKSHLDLACGTGIFVAGMTELGIESSGLDISEAMIKSAKRHYPQLKFTVGDIRNFKVALPVDLITCNFDSINHLPEFSDWQKVFNRAYAGLSEKGRFVFDVNTVRAINHTDVTEHSTFNDQVLIKKIYNRDDRLVFDLEWFVKSKNNLYKRYFESLEEVAFPFAQIKKALFESGFKKVSIINSHINRTTNTQPENKTRLYVLAEK